MLIKNTLYAVGCTTTDRAFFLFELYAVCDILSKNVQRDDSINFYNIAKDGYALWRTLIISRWTGYFSR